MQPNNDQVEFGKTSDYRLLAPHIHLPSKFFSALDIRKVATLDKEQLRELVQKSQNDDKHDSAVFITMNNDHAMIFIVPYNHFQKIYLKHGKQPTNEFDVRQNDVEDKELYNEAEIGRDYGEYDATLGEEWYRVSAGAQEPMFMYHLTIEDNEYIIERYIIGKQRQLINNNNTYSIGNLWNNVAQRKYYFHTTKFNQKQFDLLVISLIKRENKIVSLNSGYCLTQNDCLEFAKRFISELLELEQNHVPDLIKSKLRSLTIMKDSVIASSEFSSRNVTVVGLSAGASYSGAVKISDRVENKQQRQTTVIIKNGSPVPWIILSSVITAAVTVAYFKLWSK